MLSWRSFWRTAPVAVALTVIASIGFATPVVSTGAADVVVKESTPEQPPSVEVKQLAVPDAEPAATAEEDLGDDGHDEANSHGPDGELVAELPATRTADFGLVGVTWEGTTAPDGLLVEVRTRSADGWEDWQELHGEDSDEQGGRGGTEAMWVGDADGVAVRVTSTTGEKPADLKIATIDAGEDSATEATMMPASYDPTNDSSTALTVAEGTPTFTSRPTIIRRSQWGASGGTTCSAPLTGQTTKGVVIHHTAGSNSYSQAESDNIVRAVQAYHVKGQNWCDIGYNFLVDKYGQIFEGRKGGIDLPVRAAHSGNAAVNTETMGVSMMGNFDTEKPSAALKEAVVKLVGWRMGTTYMKAKGTYSLGGKTLNLIAGHRNVVGTACPGSYGYAWLGEAGGLRDRVEVYMANFTSEIETAAQKLGSSTIGVVRVGETGHSGGRKTRYSKGDFYSYPGAGAHFMAYGLFRTEYNRLKAQTGPMRFPSSDIGSNPKVRYQRFLGGTMYGVKQSNGSEKAFGIAGSVHTEYQDMGASGGAMGLPTSSVATNFEGTDYARFTNGSIYGIKQSNGTFKAFGLYGGVWEAYQKAGATVSKYGAPTSRVTESGGVQKATFEHGTITFDGSSGQTSTGGDDAAAANSSNSMTVPSSGIIKLTGHGYGHGIGMSQYGAQGAALAGKTYGAILGFYYPGTTLESTSSKIRVLISKATYSGVTVKQRTGLKFRDVASNTTTALHSVIGGKAVSQWRIQPNPSKTTQSLLQYRTSGWAYTTYKNIAFTGDGQFEGYGPLTMILPDGSGVEYRGALRSALPKKGSSVRDTVNILDLDEYTKGVIAAEMPSSWKPEALKAQSVAARTYGARSITSSRYYDICDTTSCQVYRGVSAETTNTNNAVGGTASKILTSGGSPAFTQFSSSSGGYTAKGSFDYLPAKADPWDDWDGNSKHEWTTSVSASKIEKAYSAIGTLKKLTISKRTGGGDWGGRVSSITLVGSKGSKTISGNDARWSFGLYSNWFGFS